MYVRAYRLIVVLPLNSTVPQVVGQLSALNSAAKMPPSARISSMLFKDTHCPKENRQMINGSLNSQRLVSPATPSDGGVIWKSRYNGAGNSFEAQCFTDIGLCSEAQAERRLSISSIWSPSELWTRENTTIPAGRPRLLRHASWAMPCDGFLHCLQTYGRTGMSYNKRSFFDILQSPSKPVNHLLLDNS